MEIQGEGWFGSGRMTRGGGRGRPPKSRLREGAVEALWGGGRAWSWNWNGAALVAMGEPVRRGQARMQCDGASVRRQRASGRSARQP